MTTNSTTSHCQDAPYEKVGEEFEFGASCTFQFFVIFFQSCDVFFVGDSLIAELFVGLGDVIFKDKSNVNFLNWRERWNTAYKYNNRLKKRNLTLQCTKSSECYSDINENCMKCMKQFSNYDFIIYGNAHIISQPKKWHHILHPLHTMSNTALVTHPLIVNDTFSDKYYAFIKNETKYRQLRVLDWYRATDNELGKKERLDGLHSTRYLAIMKAMFLMQRICPVPLLYLSNDNSSRVQIFK